MTKTKHIVINNYKKYNMGLIAQVLELYSFKVIESGENKCLMEKQ